MDFASLTIENCSELIGGLLASAGAHSIIYSPDTNHINCGCPFAPFRHTSGDDSHPSFSVNLTPPFLSFCFACDTRGPLPNLLMDIAERTKNTDLYLISSTMKTDMRQMEIGLILNRLDAKEAVAKARAKQSANPFVDISDTTKREFPYDIFDESQLAMFRKSIPRYAEKRGITIEMAKHWGLMFDRHEIHPRLIFPIRDRCGNLVGVQGRRIRESTPQKYYNYWNFKKGLFLYGRNFVDSKWVVVVEGMIDTIFFQSYGIPTVGIMGCHLSDEQTELLSEFKKVILAFDGDLEGERGQSDASDRLKSRVILLRMPIEKGKDPKDYKKSEAETLVRESSLVL